MIKLILKLIRVKQWVKNAFVLAPLLFSLQFTDISSVVNAELAFFAFCFISSVVYVINDICDRKKDALHQKNKNRPIANGKINPLFASFIAFGLFALACVCLYMLDSYKTTLVIALYVIMNVLYSWKLKQIVLIDVLIIAIGFIFRVYAGAYAIAVPVSSFIFMTTLFLSLFLGFTKRKGELLRSGTDARDVLTKYSKEMLTSYVNITVALTIMSYALYTLEAPTIAKFETNRLIYSVIFVILGLFRYIWILDKNENAEDPTENLLKDYGLISICSIYVIYILAIFTNII